MCGGVVSDAWDATTDFVESAVEYGGNLATENPWLSFLPLPIPGLNPFPFLAPFSDFSSMDDDPYKPGSGLVDLSGLPTDYLKKPIEIAFQMFTTVEFVNVHENMASSTPEATEGHAEIWETLANELAAAVTTFNSTLTALENGQDGLKGETATAATANIRASFNQLNEASKGSHAMVTLVPKFAEAVRKVRDWVQANIDGYNADKENWPERFPEIKKEYDAYAQGVMEDYRKNVQAVAAANPDLSGGTPAQPPGPAAPAGTPQNYGAGGPGGPGTGMPGQGSGAPVMPTRPTSDPSLAQANPAQGQNVGQDAAKAATDAAKSATDAATDAAGQAADAAQQAMEKALGAIGDAAGPGGLPEGVLGLGPGGLAGANPAGGGGRGGGPNGGGAGAKPALAANKPAAMAASTKSAGTPVTAARAGLSGAAGSPGAGAPAAGQRGQGADGSVHKANKALRRKKNGEDVMGDADAVVAVVGDDAPPDPAAPPTPKR